MTLEHKRYMRQQHALEDPKQTILTTEGIIHKTQEIKYEINYTQTVYCPFCLTKKQLSAFLIKRKTGYHKGLGLCPECQQKMRLQTLADLLKMTPEKYAEWIYDYVSAGFWSKCKYDLWKKHLYDLGFSTRFWNRYKELKGDSPSEKT